MYDSYEVKRMAILGTMPVTTAPRPLYKPRGVSFLIISEPVLINPRGLTCHVGVSLLTCWMWWEGEGRQRIHQELSHALTAACGL